MSVSVYLITGSAEETNEFSKVHCRHGLCSPTDLGTDRPLVACVARNTYKLPCRDSAGDMVSCRMDLESVATGCGDRKQISRALAGATGGVFVVLAIFGAMAESHIGNTMWFRTRDGMEAVGDDIVLSGPNWGNVIMLIGAAGFAFWFGIAKRESKQ